MKKSSEKQSVQAGARRFEETARRSQKYTRELEAAQAYDDAWSKTGRGRREIL